MSNHQITKMLNMHYIPYKIEDGHIIADCMVAFSEPFDVTEDVTGYTKRQLLDWLGY